MALRNIRPHLFLLGAGLIYGANYSIAKIALPEYVLPFGFIVIRVTAALAIYTIFHFFAIREKVDRSDLPKLALCALFGVVINQLMFFKGLSLTSEIHASLIMITTPIIVLLLSNLVLKERITLAKGLGVLLGASGVTWLILQGKAEIQSSASFTGDIFILINAASYGIYLVLVKPLMAKYHPVTIVKWIFFFGLFIVIPVGFGEFRQIDWQALPADAWFSVIYVVIGTTFLAYLFNAMAIRDIEPSIVGVYIYLQPLIATLIAVMVGNDSLDAAKVISAILIMAGVGLASGFIRIPRRS